ncbi:MBL fold metallo-hydrolase [Candidatus Entotheonella palauensis]|uniref:MBL fold metallo-hydrolase n=1 Tax=Candidatus Entotheonella palauensis TaxID=93172 RepID=UPI000B7F7F6B|nr:MBL fold metallo-hydrolase [Candidatus Entotheonella palauensis]
MQITFRGTRGSIPAPGPQTARYGGNTSCVEVRLEDETLLIFDAGTGIRTLGGLMMSEPGPIEAYIFLTHMHWDHIQGLPFFGPAFLDTTRLHFFGPEEPPLTLEQVLCDQMRRPYYPIPMHAMAGRMDFTAMGEGSVSYAVPGAKIEASELNHPGKTLGFRLKVEGKVFVYATDNEPFGTDPVTQHLVSPPRLVEFARDADLLIQDAQYTQQEYPQRLGWGHSTHIDALQLARDAGVKQLALYHHDPTHSDADIDQMVAQCQAWMNKHQAGFTFFAAAEGDCVTL